MRSPICESLPPIRHAALVAATLQSMMVAAAAAQDAPPSRDTVPKYELAPLTVTGRADDLVGRASTASVGYVGFRDLARRPLSREGELLETVPGMILTQHSGSGKSNQMFVRGFNLDHGTDFSTRVEGMPVNIPTHAHGHGYTDLNFITPEFVDHVEYALGPYYADIGDFGSAGGARIRLRDRFERPLVVVGLGENGHRRAVAAGSTPLGASGTLLAGAEFRGYDGPWDVPEDLRKWSGLVRYTREAHGRRLSVLAMAYDNAWNASDQIPLRAVESGRISRFGQIDETLGGASSRASLSATWDRTLETSRQHVEVFGIGYSLDLFSNFTYRLDDPDGGDQFRQQDDGRFTGGLDAWHRQRFSLGGREHQITVGAQLRGDRADVTLSRTRARETVATIRRDAVRQYAAGVYAEWVTEWSDRWTATVGLRGDAYRFDVDSDRPANTGTDDDAILSPKATVAFRPTGDTELSLAGGLGFHSNDARGTVTTVDPVSGEPTRPIDPLVRSRGAEIGVRSSPVDGLRTTASLWTVDLDSELLFVGDAGTTEASDASRRVGLTVANFWRIDPRWSADLDVSLTRARFRDVEAGFDRIPGALENVVAAGISFDPLHDGPFGALRVRRFGSYPLVEDDGVRADAAALVNLQVGYRLGALRLGLGVFNLFDEAHSDIQYFYASRLAGEPAGGIEDRHVHPAEPRAFRVQVSWGY